MTETVYKLVTEFSADKTISSVFAIREGIAITYRPGEWISPTIPHSVIFAFDTRGNAEAFVASHLYDTPFGIPERRWRLWRAEAENVRPFRGCLDASFLEDDEAVDLVHKFWLGSLGMAYMGFAPTGTVGCSAIRLDRQIG